MVSESHASLEMKGPRIVTIWLPLPASSGWRGEGIVQTVEHFLAHLPGDSLPLVFELVVSPVHASLVAEQFRSHPQVRIRPLKFLTGKGRRQAFSADRLHQVLSRPTIFDQIRAALHRWAPKNPWWSYGGWLRYGFILSIYVGLQRLGCGFRNRVFWFPSPLIPLTAPLRGRKVCSFWDPFIFEYGAFQQVGRKLYPAFLRHFSQADRIITQSEFNRTYLTQVLGIPSDRIHLVRNGSPDYSQYRFPDDCAAQSTRERILQDFGRKIFYGPYSMVLDRYVDQALAKSLLMRLLTKRKADPGLKTIFISTQYRPHKGLDEWMEVVLRLVRGEGTAFRYQFVFTTPLPPEIRQHFPDLREPIHEFYRLSNRDHATIYQLSDLVVHPSHAEGGAFPYPLFEAASLGVPCLVNRGRHLDEALESCPDLACAVFDVNRPAEAVQKIDRCLQEPEWRNHILKAARSAWRDWDDAAQEYCRVFEDVG